MKLRLQVLNDPWIRLSLGLHIGLVILAVVATWWAAPQLRHYAPPPSSIVHARMVHLSTAKPKKKIVKPVHKMVAKPKKVAKPYPVPAKHQVALHKPKPKPVVHKKPPALPKPKIDHSLEKNLMQEMAEEQQRQAAAAAALQRQKAAVIDRYRGLILQAISQYWLMPPSLRRGVSCDLAIDLAPDGTVLAARLLRSSGNPGLDSSARSAVWKASPLPVPQDIQAFAPFRHLQLTVRKGV